MRSEKKHQEVQEGVGKAQAILRGKDPVQPLEKLPNGATVLELRRTSGPSKEPRWYVFCVWVRNGAAEYISWQLFPDTLACEYGSYNRNPAQAYEQFVKRADVVLY